MHRGFELLIVPGTDFLRAYAGTRYLIERLHAAGIPLTVWLHCTQKSAHEYRQFPFRCRIFSKRLVDGTFPGRLEMYVYRVIIFMRMLFSTQVLITESTYLREAALVKKMKGSRFKLIQFCQELHIQEEYPSFKMAQWYAKHAQAPDLVIDVEPNRARVRMERVGLKELPLVLFNTIPLNALPDRLPAGSLITLAGVDFPDEMPILLHMGGIGKEKPLERVIDAVAMCEAPVFFLAFCNGAESQIITLQNYAKEKLGDRPFRICSGVARDQLLGSAWEADIGVIDYTYSVEPTSNQKYCAPTKLYEFMALGLAVLASNNDSLRAVVEKERIGVCSSGDSETDLGDALSSLLCADLESMQARSREAFVEHYSYEKLCGSVGSDIVSRLSEFCAD